MKTEPNEPINPVEVSYSDGQWRSMQTGCSSGMLNGLTKRELMAIEFTKATMIGIITASGFEAHNWSPKEFAQKGLEQADALILALNEDDFSF